MGSVQSAHNRFKAIKISVGNANARFSHKQTACIRTIITINENVYDFLFVLVFAHLSMCSFAVVFFLQSIRNYTHERQWNIKWNGSDTISYEYNSEQTKWDNEADSYVVYSKKITRTYTRCMIHIHAHSNTNICWVCNNCCGAHTSNV